MKGLIKLSFLLFFFLNILACNRIKTPEAVAQREEWIKSFHDSLDYYENQMKIIDSRLSDCNEKINSLISNFQYVKNPREVTGYHILKGWSSKIPFTSTSVYARISDDEKLELIATLSGATFNRIGISNGLTEISSQTVFHDQAMNFRHNGYNTVCFIGESADSIAQLISKNRDKNLTLSFYEGSSQKKNFTIPENEKQMISTTWDLIDIQNQQKELQKELWLTSQRINICRKMIEKADSIENSNN